MLYGLKGDDWKLGFPVDLHEHCVQSATRAFLDLSGAEVADDVDDLAAARDAMSDESAELVVCALLHDVGELMCPVNHGDIVA